MIRTTLFCIVLLMPSMALGQNNDNPADFIMKAVAQRAAENERLKKTAVEYKKSYIIKDLNSKGEEGRKKKDEVELVVKGKGKIIERFGRPIKNGGVGSTPNIDFAKAMADFYDFNMAPTPLVMINGRAYHVIEFGPTRGTPHPKGDLEEILARMAGTIYIEIENLSIYKIRAKLVKEYSRILSIYKLHRADIELTQMEFNNIVVVDSLIIIDKYSIFGVEILEKQIITHKDYIYKP